MRQLRLLGSILLAIFLFCLLVFWTLSGFTQFAKSAEGAMGGVVFDLLFIAVLGLYWWTHGVGIDLGFVKIPGIGWEKEKEPKEG